MRITNSVELFFQNRQHPSYFTSMHPYVEIRDKNAVLLSKRNILFGEFVISANKSRESRQVLPCNVSILRENILQSLPAQTSADLLTATGNIMVRKSRAGGLRYNVNYMRSVFNNPMLPLDTTQIMHGAVTGSASLVYHPRPEFRGHPPHCFLNHRQNTFRVFWAV